MHYSLLTWRNHSLINHKDRSHNVQNRRYCEVSSHIVETYKNTVQPHGCHICNTAADMDREEMCPCNSKHRGMLQETFVLRCCDKCSSIVLPSQEANKYTTNTCLKIRFHVYCNI